MKAVTIHDAKTNLSKYIARAKKGEKIYIGSFGKTEVMLTIADKKKETGKRDFSKLKGLFTYVSDDAFSPEVDKEIADMMTKGFDE